MLADRMADGCFRAAWPLSHVNFLSERHFLIAGAAGHGIAAFRPLVPRTRSQARTITLGARGWQCRLAGKGSIPRWQIAHCRSREVGRLAMPALLRLRWCWAWRAW